MRIEALVLNLMMTDLPSLCASLHKIKQKLNFLQVKLMSKYYYYTTIFMHVMIFCKWKIVEI